MNSLKVSSLYVLDLSEPAVIVKKKIETKNLPAISEDVTRKQWEKNWFAVKNAMCLECSKKCKQSAYVTICYCPSFKKKGK